jgi:cyanate permease
MIEETFAYGLVIGCSLFGIFWGIVNVLMVRIIHHYFSKRNDVF